MAYKCLPWCKAGVYTGFYSGGWDNLLTLMWGLDSSHLDRVRTLDFIKGVAVLH